MWMLRRKEWKLTLANSHNWALTRELAAFACCTWFEGYSTTLAGKRLFNFLFDIEDESENNYEFIKEYVTEFVSIDPERISLNVMLSAYLGVDVQEEINKILKYERDGTALSFVLGEKNSVNIDGLS